MADDLYSNDYYAWTLKQADTLRKRESGANALDWDHLAEEVEGLGSEVLTACESFVAQIMAHFLKLEFSIFDDPRAGWVDEILHFRFEIEMRLTAALGAKIKGDWDDIYRKGAKLASRSFKQHEPDTKLDAPAECPYSWEDVMGRGEDWIPERRA